MGPRINCRKYGQLYSNLLASLVIATIAGGCGGSSGDDATALSIPPQPSAPDIAVSLETELARLNALPTPEGTDESVFAALKAQLASMLRAKGAEKLTSAPPMLPASSAYLSWDSDTSTLNWGYCCTGDYNQNSLVEVADITPLGVNWQTQSPDFPSAFPAANELSVVDGNSNGLIEIADITPIGQNFQARVAAYNIYASSVQSDYPSGAASGNGGAALLASVPFPEGPPPAGQRRMFSFAVSDPQPETYFWVRPTDGSTEGTPSNYYYLATPANNPPVASLAAEPLAGNPPLLVSLDASASYDPDGEIVKYEWDWTGFTDGWQWVDSGMESTQQHEYQDYGNYGCTVRVTDADGATDLASVQITVSEPQAPVAALTASPLFGPPPLTVNFSAAESHDPDGAIENFEWDLDGDGDFGETGSEALAEGSAETAYTYSELGAYTVAVRVTDNADNTDSASAGIVVSDPNWSMFGHDARRTGCSPCVSAQTNDLKWSCACWVGDLYSSSPAISTDGTVYIACSRWLYAVKPDGNQKWYLDAGALVDTSPAIGADGTVYVGCVSGNFYAVDSDGDLKWTYATGNAVYSSAVIGADATIYVGSDDYKLYAINHDGSLQWSYSTNDWVRSSPAIGLDGAVYVGSWDGKLYAINPDGTLKWAFDTGNAVQSSPAVGSDGTIYVCDATSLLAVRPDGGLAWSAATDGFVHSSPAIGMDGSIYLGTDIRVQAFNPDGSARWTFPAGSFPYSSPAVCSDGTVYIGVKMGISDWKVCAINSDGSLKWSYNTGDYVYSSPAIAADGTLYIGCLDGKLYAF